MNALRLIVVVMKEEMAEGVAEEVAGGICLQEDNNADEPGAVAVRIIPYTLQIFALLKNHAAEDAHLNIFAKAADSWKHATTQLIALMGVHVPTTTSAPVAAVPLVDKMRASVANLKIDAGRDLSVGISLVLTPWDRLRVHFATGFAVQIGRGDACINRFK